MTDSNSEKVAVVTGASSGIGAATVKALLQGGAKVIAVARRAERLASLATDCKVNSGQLLSLQLDLRDEAAVEQLARNVFEWTGRLDVLINNAGVSRGAPNEEASLQDTRLMLDTNVFALINVTRVMTPMLRASKGVIVNVSSTAAKAALPNGAVYSASKAAVATFSESLRKELAPHNVRVIAVFPGFVDTELFDGFSEKKKQEFDKMRQLIDVLRPEDVARILQFAISQPSHVAMNEIVVRPTKQVL